MLPEVFSQAFSLTYEELRRLCPRGEKSLLEGLVTHSKVLQEYGLTQNELRLCHFLAQAAHETAGFVTLVEYGSGRYFRRRYGYRRDLGNKNAQDGATYRGRGIFQLTGRTNYRRYGQILNIDLEANPVLAASPEISLRIACEYWRQHNLSDLADQNDIKAITKKINGGFNGLRDRRRYFLRARSIWSLEGSQSLYPRLLRVGDQGADVKSLQDRLHAAGYPLIIDGWFGRHTRRALVAFQKANTLRPDGVFGPRSREKLGVPRTFATKSPSEKSLSTKLKEKFMNQWKSYFLSRTIWANLIGFAALALDVLGFNGISAEDQSQLIDQLLKLVEAGGFIAGVIFRAIARERLGPTLF